MRIRRASAALLATVIIGSGLTACSGGLPQVSGCVDNATVQGLLTKKDAAVKSVVCAGSDWAMASFTYTNTDGATGRNGEAVFYKADGKWNVLVQGVDPQELCTPSVKERLAKAPSPIKEIGNACK